MTDFSEILQTNSPFAPGEGARLPGLAPVGDAPLFWRDEAFAAQMSYRAWLLENHSDAVLAQTPDAQSAIAELIHYLMGNVSGYTVNNNKVTRPDGVELPYPSDMASLAMLVQEDLCLLEKRGAEHVLSAAALCFPASWTLAQKIGKPLITIHNPVETYDADMAKRVQRVFDGLHPSKPIWRANNLRYASADLHQPRSEGEPHEGEENGKYRRVERQVLAKLPKTGAVLFSIHTFVTLA